MFHTLRKSLIVTFFALVLIEGFLMGCAQVKLDAAGRILMQLVVPDPNASEACDVQLAGK